jgi:uncharacterized protein
MQFVFDTNVLISAALTKGESRKAFELAQAIGTVCYSDDTFLELVATLEKPKLQHYLLESHKIEFLASFLSLAKSFPVSEKVDACRDQKDNIFLEIALACTADAIISGDHDLLELNPFRKIPIVTPVQFLGNFSI